MILIKVFLNKEAEALNARVLEQRIEWDFSLRFPVDETITVFRAIFGKQAVIRFDFM